MRLSGNYFWGILFVVAGVSLIIKHTFHINISVMRIVIGFVLIYAGISVFAGGFGIRTSNDFVFDNGHVSGGELKNEYNFVFGSGDLNTADIDVTGTNRRVEVHTIFSSGIIRIDPEMPVIIKASSVFGNARLPDSTSINFGDYTYRTKAFKEGQPHLEIKADVVFGKLDVIER